MKWLVDYHECDSFIFGRKLPSHTSEKYIDLEETLTLATKLNSNFNLTVNTPKEINKNKMNNTGEKAFPKNEEKRIKYFSVLPPREEIWRNAPKATLSYRDEKWNNHYQYESNDKAMSKELTRTLTSKESDNGKIVIKRDITRGRGMGRYHWSAALLLIFTFKM